MIKKINILILLMILIVGCNPMGDESVVAFLEEENESTPNNFQVIFSLTSSEKNHPKILPITYSITFSSAPNSFLSTDITFSGTANIVSYDISGSGTSYQLLVRGLAAGSSGTVIPSIAAGVLTDITDEVNDISTVSASDTVTINGPVLSVSSGNTNTCALLATGAIGCWGGNTDGESTVPNELNSVGEASMVSTGGGSTSGFACGVTALGKILCWGNNADSKIIPSASLQLDNSSKSVSVGLNHACAVTLAGQVLCWGNASWAKTTVPASLQVNNSTSSLSLGANHSCALKTDGSVMCWGQDTFNQSTVPSDVDSVGEATAVATGSRYSCALKTDGSITCWGKPDATNNTTVDVDVDGAGEASDIDLGGLHSCALKSDSSIVCWEDDSNGQSTVPGALTAGNSALSVSGGDQHTCVVQNDGRLNCFGSNIDGQLNIPGGL